MSTPLDDLSPSEQTIVKNIIRIMLESSKTKSINNSEDFNYLVNNAEPMVRALKKAIASRLVSLGVDKVEADSMLSALAQIAQIAGGISFADYTITERMMSNLGDSDEIQ
jgi:hypothetical protein